ncbi:hypothetical protein ACRQ5Q_35965 [Bradyrhizobium sp. PMVTL-01]|uniref:hypothetical protein n=1 Tax=unclassified Bradyrhizobium TaxID=2631580 RepID=UPI003F71CF38
MAAATWFELGASLILAGVNAIVAIALIGFSLSLLTAVILVTQYTSFKAALTHLGGKQEGLNRHGF